MSAFVGLGGNVGGNAAIRARFRDALRRIAALGYVESVEVSRVYRSAAVGTIRDQPAFLNAVARAELRETIAPEEVLADLLAIEAALGRVRSAPGGPRTIDLDLLLVDAERWESSTLSLPHPRLAERAFVLLPLVDLVGRAWRVPVVDQELGALLDRALFAPDQACDIAAVFDDHYDQPG